MVDPDVRFLHAAADATRLAILRELSSEGSVRACDLTACCTVHQPTVSHHLRVLREAGWVCSERHGANISYKLCEDAVARFRQIAGELRPGGGSLPMLPPLRSFGSQPAVEPRTQASAAALVVA